MWVLRKSRRALFTRARQDPEQRYAGRGHPGYFNVVSGLNRILSDVKSAGPYNNMFIYTVPDSWLSIFSSVNGPFFTATAVENLRIPIQNSA